MFISKVACSKFVFCNISFIRDFNNFPENDFQNTIYNENRNRFSIFTNKLGNKSLVGPNIVEQ